MWAQPSQRRISEQHSTILIWLHGILQVVNSRGHVLQCSHYMPHFPPKDEALPCVIYCHGNRLDTTVYH